jgi:hypothetical protein
MRHNRETINILVEKTETGYSAYGEEIEVFTTGEEIEDLYENLILALNLFYEDSGRKIDIGDLRIKMIQ